MDESKQDERSHERCQRILPRPTCPSRKTRPTVGNCDHAYNSQLLQVEAGAPTQSNYPSGWDTTRLYGRLAIPIGQTVTVDCSSYSRQFNAPGNGRFFDYIGTTTTGDNTGDTAGESIAGQGEETMTFWLGAAAWAQVRYFYYELTLNNNPVTSACDSASTPSFDIDYIYVEMWFAPTMSLTQAQTLMDPFFDSSG